MNIDIKAIKNKILAVICGLGDFIFPLFTLPSDIARFMYRRTLIDKQPAYLIYFIVELAVVCYFSTLHNLVGLEMSKNMIWLGLSYIFFTFSSIYLEDRLERHLTEYPLMLTQAIYCAGTFMILSHNL